ncbi:hypothetical protein [Bosea sp. Root381]|uniref:hypothetical protein n=1 Tax=Bosea sp. Root381 TaxID=1736524 RepID=UPI0012E3934B|nr:hypothetical protein [Bosea sp. Root381]
MSIAEHGVNAEQLSDALVVGEQPSARPARMVSRKASSRSSLPSLQRRALCLRIAGPIADLVAALAPQFRRDGRRLAIQSRNDLPDRLPGSRSRNRTALFKR